MTDHVTPLVLAKAPVPGRVKTRLGADVGDDVAADLAAAALLDTLDQVDAAFPGVEGVVALAGDLAEASQGATIGEALTRWRVVPQVGATFAERIAHAHAQVAGPVLQVGMDTPHLPPDLLVAAADALEGHDGVLGPAEDGGWWLLALRDPAYAGLLREVPTSRPDTGELTLRALRRELDVVLTATAYDVDTVAEAERAAAEAPHTRFARTWAALERSPR